MSHRFAEPKCICDAPRRVKRVVGLTAGNDLKVELSCGHAILLDTANWVETKRGFEPIGNAFYCTHCERACPRCSRS